MVSITIHHLAVVHLPTVEPDLSLVPGERANVTHVDHGARERVQESIVIRAICLHERNGIGSPIDRRISRVELLVRLEKPLVIDQVGVVLVVEGVGCGEVEVGERVRVGVSTRADALQLHQVLCAQRGVRLSGPAEVVKPRSECGTMGIPDRVSTYTKYQVHRSYR